MFRLLKLFNIYNFVSNNNKCTINYKYLCQVKKHQILRIVKVQHSMIRNVYLMKSEQPPHCSALSALAVIASHRSFHYIYSFIAEEQQKQWGYSFGARKTYALELIQVRPEYNFSISAITHQPLAISHQPLAISHQTFIHLSIYQNM